MNCFNVLEQLALAWDSEVTDLDFDQKYQLADVQQVDYVSVFRIKGRPILPPLMTESRRDEMREYRRQALLREAARNEKLQFTKDININDGCQPCNPLRLSDNDFNNSLEEIHTTDSAGSLQQNQNSDDLDRFTSSTLVSCCSGPEMSKGFISCNSSDKNRVQQMFNDDRFANGNVVTHTDAIISRFNVSTAFSTGHCDLPASRDSGLQSSSYHMVSVSASQEELLHVSRPVGATSLVMSSVQDSGMFSKDLTTAVAASERDYHLETSLEVDEITLDENDDVSSISTTKNLDFVSDQTTCEKFMHGAASLSSSKDVDVLDLGSFVLSEFDDVVNSTDAEQTISDELMKSKDSNVTLFSTDSNKTEKTVVACNDLEDSHSNCDEDLNSQTVVTGDSAVCDESVVEVIQSFDESGQNVANDKDVIVANQSDFSQLCFADTGDKIANKNQEEKETETTGVLDSLCEVQSDGFTESKEINGVNSARIEKFETDIKEDSGNLQVEESELCGGKSVGEIISVDLETAKDPDCQSELLKQEPHVDIFSHCENQPGKLNGDCYDNQKNILEMEREKTEDGEGKENEELVEVSERMNGTNLSDSDPSPGEVEESEHFHNPVPDRRITDVLDESNKSSECLVSRQMSGVQTSRVTKSQTHLQDSLVDHSVGLSDIRASKFANAELRSLVNVVDCDTVLSSVAPAVSQDSVSKNSSQPKESPERAETCLNGLSDVSEVVVPKSRVRRDSYVISASDNSQVTVSDCHTEDCKGIRRNNSYTLDRPSDALLAADAQSLDMTDTVSHNRTRESADHGNVVHDMTDTVSHSRTRESADHGNVVNVQVFGEVRVCGDDLLTETEKRESVPAKKALDSGASALAAMRARAESERIGKLEHLRRFLQQVSDLAPPRNDEGDVHDFSYESMNCDAQRPSDRVLPVAPPSGHTSFVCSNVNDDGVVVTNSEVVLNNVGNSVGVVSSCDLPNDMSEGDLLNWLNTDFERKKHLLEAEHQRHMAQLLAEQHRQEMALQMEILRYQQQLHSKAVSVQKSRSDKSVNLSTSCSTSSIRFPVDQASKLSDKSRNVEALLNASISRNSDVVVPSGSISSVLLQPKTGFAVDDIRAAISPDELYYRQRYVCGSMSSLSTIQDNESDNPYKSPAVLRQRKNVSSSCSPHVPMYASPPGLRQRVSMLGTPSSGLATSMNTAHATSINEESVDVAKKFERLPALVKGYLTRRLLKSERVQYIIQTIQDTAEFALRFQLESPMKKGFYSMQDRHLHDRVIAQLTAAMYEIHEIFFDISMKERMHIIAQSRAFRQEKLFKTPESAQSSVDKTRRISAATLKAIERKRKSMESGANSKHPTTKAPSGDQFCKSSKDKSSGVAAPSRQYKNKSSMKPGRAQLSPRKPGKENVHRIIGKERTQVIGTNKASARANGMNGNTTKASSNAVQPVRKIARMTEKLAEEGMHLERGSTKVPAKNTHQKTDAHQFDLRSDAVVSRKTRFMLPNYPSDYAILQNIDAERLHFGSTSQPSSSNQSGFKNANANTVNQSMLHQRHQIKHETILEKELTRKVAYVQERFS